MDIVDRFVLLREKIKQPKHQKVDIAFQTSLDFLQYIRQNEDIITKLINTDEINYIDNDKEMQKYETDNIINVTIGIRNIGKPLKVIENKETWKRELEKKQEKLQEIRHLTAQLSLDKKNKKIVEAKKEDMAILKKDIEKLEYEIKKSRMNEK